MGGIFGKPKKPSRITDTDRSILTLKSQKDQLLIVRNKLTHQHDVAENTVRKLLFEKKTSLALIALRHKKHQMELLTQAEEYLLQVNQVISNVEMASVQKDVVKAMDAGRSALSAIQAELNVDYIEQLLKDNADLTSDVQDVSTLLANTRAEDEELFKEYESLQAQVDLQRIDVETPPIIHEVSVPSSSPRQIVQARPRDLDEPEQAL